MLLFENGKCAIANIRVQHLLQILIRDNAGELKSADLNAYVQSLDVKNYFSVAYEQYQNGSAEPTIDSLMILNRTQMVESWNGLILVSGSCKC